MSEEELALDSPQPDVGEAEATEPDAPETEASDESLEPALGKEEEFKAKLKEAISVHKEEIGPLRLKMTVSVPRELLDEKLQEQFQDLRKEALIPGFRKGHAPLKLVEKRFATDVGEELKTRLIANGYLAAVDKEDLKPLGDPLFCVRIAPKRTGPESAAGAETEKLLPLDDALDHLTLPKEGALTFSCEVELKPQFELPKLDGIPVTRPKVSVTEADVAEEFRRLCAARGTFEPVENAPIEANDLLYATVVVSLDGQEVAREENVELAARDLGYKGIPLAGLGQAVVGRKAGETLTFTATVPDDHEDVAWRGKPATFEFTLHEAKRLRPAVVDQTFLSNFGCDTEQELRNTIRYDLESALGNSVESAMRSQIADYLLSNTVLDVPAGISRRQTEKLIARRILEMYEANIPRPEIAKAVDEMQARVHEQAVRDLKLYFVLEKIADAMDIDVSEEEINSAIARIARRSNQRFDRVRDELSKRDGLASMYVFMRDRKVLDTLLQQAAITEIEGPKDESTT